jgi:hypothetical protein
MSSRSSRVLAVSLLSLIALLGGCKPKPKNPTVVVRVVRNLRSAYGSEIDRRILEFQGDNPRLPSGQPVIISTDTGDYRDMLQKQTGASDGAALILLDAPEDAAANPMLQTALPGAANICAGVRSCPANVPAIIPPQVGGTDRQGAQLFVEFLQKTAAPEPAAPASTTGTATPSATAPSATTGGTTTTPGKP